jgi:hypothetical protein
MPKRFSPIKDVCKTPVFCSHGFQHALALTNVQNDGQAQHTERNQSNHHKGHRAMRTCGNEDRNSLPTALQISLEANNMRRSHDLADFFFFFK